MEDGHSLDSENIHGQSDAIEGLSRLESLHVGYTTQYMHACVQGHVSSTSCYTRIHTVELFARFLKIKHSGLLDVRESEPQYFIHEAGIKVLS